MSHPSQPPRGATLQQFLDGRSPLAFWVTYNVNNPIGACIAWLAFRLGMTPNQVSWMSLVVGLSGPAVLASGWSASRPIEALFILISLQAGYTLDGADGMLARVSAAGSRFGQMLDKLIDAMVLLLLPSLLYFASLGSQSSDPFGVQGILVVTFLAIFSRSLLAIHFWLKEYVERGGDRTVGDTRQRSLGYYVRRGIGQSTDTSSFYFMLALSWAFDCYWPFLAVYSTWTLVVWLAYLAVTYGDLSKPSLGA